MQLTKQSVLAAVAAGEVKPDEGNLIHYSVVFGEKGATHQHQVTPESVEDYKAKEAARAAAVTAAEVFNLEQALALGAELVNVDAINKELKKLR